MIEATSKRAYWVIYQVNTQTFMARFNHRWARTRDLGAAALFSSQGEAEVALQALHQEAADRVGKNKKQWPAQMWWDIHGGLTTVVEAEVSTRVNP